MSCVEKGLDQMATVSLDCAGLTETSTTFLSLLNEHEIHNLVINLINDEAGRLRDNADFLAANPWFREGDNCPYLEDVCRCSCTPAADKPQAAQ